MKPPRLDSVGVRLWCKVRHIQVTRSRADASQQVDGGGVRACVFIVLNPAHVEGLPIGLRGTAVEDEGQDESQAIRCSEGDGGENCPIPSHIVGSGHQPSVKEQYGYLGAAASKLIKMRGSASHLTL
jgi:hypothetical protein